MLGEGGTQRVLSFPFSCMHVSRPLERLETLSQSLPCTYLPTVLKARGIVAQTVLCSSFHSPGQNRCLFPKGTSWSFSRLKCVLNNPLFSSVFSQS